MKACGFVALLISIWMVSCTADLRPSEITPESQLTTDNPVTAPEASSIAIPTSTTLNTLNEARWNIYDPDPEHLWNRLFRQFFARTASTGSEYGWDSLDPLL